MNKLVSIYEPFKAKNQKEYVLDCIDSNWISSRGAYIDKFESKLQDFLNVKHAITTCNGTVSLTLILYALGVGFGDEVIVPSLTYAATISSINILGAVAVLTDSDDNFQMDLNHLEKLVTKRTKAIMVPELYGDSPDLIFLLHFCDKYGIILIEDSAEVFGCSLNNKRLGSYGLASSFSFFGNKVITTGEGGCVCTNDDALAKKMRLLKSQSHIGNFVHDGPGFNFRMTNIQAAIGLAQLEEIDAVITKKKAIAQYYRDNLCADIKSIIPKADSSEWMPLFTLPYTINYTKFQSLLRANNVDTRPAFTPIHLMDGFNFSIRTSLFNSEKIYKAGFNLPSYPDLNEQTLEYVCQEVNKAVQSVG